MVGEFLNKKKKLLNVFQNCYHHTFPLAVFEVPVTPNHLQHLVWEVFNFSSSNTYLKLFNVITNELEFLSTILLVDIFMSFLFLHPSITLYFIT